jgi:hypothetical protein
MSETASLVPIEEDADLAPRVLRMRLQEGKTPAAIAKELLVSVHRVHQLLDQILPNIDGHFRRRAIGELVLVIDSVIAEHLKNVSDFESASLLIRASAEKRAILGLGPSTDPVQMCQATQSEHSLAPYQRALDAVRKRKIAAMTAKFDALVNEGKPSTDSASGDVGVLSDQKPDKPSD